MAMMARPMRVRTALVRKMPRCPSTVREPMVMTGPDTMEPIRRVFMYRPVESPGRGIICWNSGSPMPANDHVFSSCRAISRMGSLTNARPR